MAGKRLLCIGECMVELSPAGPDTFRMGFAGDTFNTAWYARRLLPAPWSVGYFSRIGTDATSDRMLEFMGASGVDTSDVGREASRTVGLYMIETRAGERSFSYWRGQSAARLLGADAGVLDTAFGRADALVFSGITMAILDPDSRNRLCSALSAARTAGKTVVFDTNMRPRLWESAETLRAGIMAGAAVADIVLPSLDEEQAQFGSLTAEDVATRYHHAGARLVVVKNGASDVTVSGPEGAFSITPPRVAQVVDTTAAGDSFNAAFLAAYLLGAPLTVAVNAAMDLAARVVQAPGALVDPG